MEILKQAAKKADEKIDFVSILKPVLEKTPFWARVAGGFASRQIEKRDHEIFEWLFNMAYEKAPKDYKKIVLDSLEAFVNDDAEGFAYAVGAGLVVAVKTPLGDEKETIIINNLIMTVFELMEKEVKIASLTVGGGGPGDDPTDPKHKKIG